ncbi:hypothetical protein [Vibrio owensii]|uniref:hypothetical protein n=1 Tax=Vibrio owensii TaxID=696485 RepID=UPI000596B1B7|nr:hypothetical protein [Vibrio owensii]
MSLATLHEKMVEKFINHVDGEKCDDIKDLTVLYKSIFGTMPVLEVQSSTPSQALPQLDSTALSPNVRKMISSFHDDSETEFDGEY